MSIFNNWLTNTNTNININTNVDYDDLGNNLKSFRDFVQLIIKHFYMDDINNCWDKLLKNKFILPVNPGSYVLREDIGLYLRHTKSAAKSCIKGVQIFPFISVAKLVHNYLQGASIKGGMKTAFSEIAPFLDIEGYEVIEKHGLPATFNENQILAFVPKHIMQDKFGEWIFMTQDEMSLLDAALIENKQLDSLRIKLAIRLKK